MGVSRFLLLFGNLSRDDKNTIKSRWMLGNRLIPLNKLRLIPSNIRHTLPLQSWLCIWSLHKISQYYIISDKSGFSSFVSEIMALMKNVTSPVLYMITVERKQQSGIPSKNASYKFNNTKSLPQNEGDSVKKSLYKQ